MLIRLKPGTGAAANADEEAGPRPRTFHCTEADLLTYHRKEERGANTGVEILPPPGASDRGCSVLRAVYAASPDGILLVTSQGTAISHNRKFAQIWRLPQEHSQIGESGLLAISSGNLLDIIADRVRAPRAFAEKLMDLSANPEQEDPREIELKDGRTLEPVSAPLKSGQGKYLGRVWFFRDITERKRHDQDLLDSERRARQRLAEIEQIYRCSPVGLGLLDRECRHVRINERLAAMGGIKASECLGKTVQEFVPELAAKIIAASRQVFEQGEAVHDLEFCANSPAGDGKHYGIANYAPFRDESGEVTGLIVSVLDITQRKLAEQAVHRLDAEFKALFNCANDAIFIVRLSDGRILEANATACARYGYSKQELLSMGIEEIESTEGEAVVRKRSEQIAKEGECRFTTEHVRKDGSRFPVEINAHRGEFRGELAGVGIIRDISERKEVESAMIRAKDAAEDAARIKSQFLANMSHEIRTPLNGVIGMTGLILDTELTPEQRRYAEIIHDSGENLISVVNGILDYSKLEARKLMLEKRSFDLSNCLRQAINILAAKAHEKDLELTCRVSPDTPLALWGDAGRLHQVLVNLVGNAVKFTLRGKVQVSVSVDSADDDSAMLRFTIADSGVGMAASQIAGLFDPFVQADGSTTRKFGGTGLGLTIARELVELMGGQIGAESEIGKGSSFWFTAEFARQRWGAAESDAGQALRGTRVLVADSQPESRASIRAMLDSWDCSSAEADDAATALSLLRDAARAGRPFRAALVDIALTGMDLGEWKREVTSDPLLQVTPLLSIVRLGVRSELAKSEAAGFAAQLTRPIWKSSLGEALTLALAGESDAHTGNPSTKRTTAHTMPLHVLLVEDNPINQEVATAILRSLGCSADLAENGREAVLAVERSEYDLVLMDCEMHEMDGYAATRKIRANEKSAARQPLPIIAMTAHALDGDREKCLAAGMNDYISKPVDPAGLAEILARWQPYGPRGAAAEPNSPPAAIANPVFDPEQLMHRVMGDGDLAALLVRGFIDQFPAKLSQFKALIKARDFGSIRLHAHSLKGAAATLAAAELGMAAEALGAAAEAGQVQDVLAVLPRLERKFTEFKHALGQAHWAAGEQKGTADEKSYCRG